MESSQVQARVCFTGKIPEVRGCAPRPELKRKGVCSWMLHLVVDLLSIFVLFRVQGSLEGCR